MENRLIEKLKNYSSSPSSQVWERIEMSLDRDRTPLYFGFDKRQIAALLIGSMMLFMFSSYMIMNGISPIETDGSHNEKIVFTKPAEIESTQIDKPLKEVQNLQVAKALVPKNKIVKSHKVASNQVIQKVSNTSAPRNTVNSVFHSAQPDKLNITDEVDGDYLAQLSERLEEITPSTHRLEVEEAPPIALKKNEVVTPKEEQKQTKNSVRLTEKKKVEANKTQQIALKKSEEVKPKESFRTELSEVKKKYSKVYLMPYIGANYTQVFYQGTPNSPYFGEDAVFNGKFGYNSGLIGGYMFGKHWGLESGVSFGQYIQSFKETKGNIERKGEMYIDQLDIPLMAKYMIHFGTEDYRKQLSFKAGLMYNSVLRYQVNYTDRDMSTLETRSYNHDADKRLYNSLQMGYVAGLDFDAFITRRLSLNLGTTTSIVSQLENFPRFRKDIRRPIQVSTIFSVGVKYNF